MTKHPQIQLNFKQRLFYFFPVLFCFLLPTGHDLIPDTQVLSGIIVLWGLTSFFVLNKEEQIKGWKNKKFWILLLFFLITCLSGLLSDNKKEAAFAIENKLAFLIIPYLIFCFPWPAHFIKKCLVSFVSGCFFTSAFLIIRAVYYYFQGHPEYFFYTGFSYFIHASYFAMYLLLAISIIFLYYPLWFKAQKNLLVVSTVFLTVFIVTVFLCSSKIGILSMFVLVPFLIFQRWRGYFNLKRGLIFLTILAVVVLVAIKFLPAAFERLESVVSVSTENIDKTSSESTTVRILIWQQCMNIIREHFLFGVGVGDANDALFKAYEQQGLSGALSHHFNAHNQYFQTFIGMGIIGFLLIAFMTLGELIRSIINKNMLLTIFCFLIIVNFLVESMLQTSAGTLFFVFFFCIFNLPQRDDLQR